jgi:diaminohydroxyphosphoribosylaminopyrimidine deaminase/5-amino-6-(5-phosphoribosylamino)uracil reductase
MQQALELARLGRYTVSPNPMVGCVIVKDNQVVGTGHHQKTGEPHAEIFALQEAGEAARGATAYVTLEPCAHHGRTPPCIDALIKAGISQVFVACTDPNPLVAGKGIEQLRVAGIEVEVGLLAKAATELNQIFFHYITTKRPFVIAKWAMSLDGKTITAATDSKQISGLEAQQEVHDLRQQVDAILIGAETARADNPELTARFNVTELSKQPIRIVVSRSGNLSNNLNIFDKKLPGLTILALSDVQAAKVWEGRGINVLLFTTLTDLLTQLAQQNITSVLVEGGEQMRQQFFAENLVNKIDVYIAPVIIGGLQHKHLMSELRCTQVGSDLKISAGYRG